MLSAEIVVKKLSRAAVATDSHYTFFTDNLDKKLKVRTIDFDKEPLWSRHGIFAIVVIDDDNAIHTLFTYHGEATVDFELYLGGNRIWPKQ